MEKTYKLNEEEKKNLKKTGKKLTQYWQDSKMKRLIFIRLFIVAPFIVMVISGLVFTSTYNDANTGWLSGFGLGMTVAFPLWIIAALYFKVAQGKSMIFCVDYGKEILSLKDEELIYSINYLWNATRIVEAHIQFDKITRIEINQKLNKLSIYGTFYELITDNMALGSNEITTKEWNKNGEDEISVKIPMYYDEIDELISILEERSGKKAIFVKEVKKGNKYVDVAA